jgi:hypothetical protein
VALESVLIDSHDRPDIFQARTHWTIRLGDNPETGQAKILEQPSCSTPSMGNGPNRRGGNSKPGPRPFPQQQQASREFWRPVVSFDSDRWLLICPNSRAGSRRFYAAQSSLIMTGAERSSRSACEMLNAPSLR